MSLSLETLLRIKSARPEIVLDDYMEDEHERQDKKPKRRSAKCGP